MRTALYARLEQHNNKWPHNAIDLTNETYVKAPSCFERCCGQQSVSGQLAYKQVMAKEYSKAVYTQFEELRGRISKGNEFALPDLIKKINEWGAGFVEGAPVMPAPPKPPAS